MKRRILLVDDDVAVLLTFKAVLEISGFDVETAASAREGKSRIRSREYHMIISDMRMENDLAGREVIQAARTASYHPAVALLTAFPDEEVGWDGAGPDKILVKATHTRVILQQIEKLFSTHAAKLSRLAGQVSGSIAAGGSTDSPEAASPSETRAARKAAKPGADGSAPKAAKQPLKTSAKKTAGRAREKVSSK